MGGVLYVVITPLCTVFQAAMGFPQVILPNAIYMFFVGASTGVIAIKVGGVRSVIIASIFSSIWYMFLPLAALLFLGLDKLGLTGLSMSADCGIWAIIYGTILKLLTGR